MQSDSDTFDCPQKFDGFRFFKKSQAEHANGAAVAEERQRWSATAMSSTNLAWGYGNHICPGRFFAVRGIKFILTKLLLEYEIKWNREKGAERPKCINVEGQFVPNLSQKLWVRPRAEM
jgi:cytochrome P450